MRFSHFFIDRPIFASVLSIIILIVGGIAQFGLPVSEYPEIAPPTVNVTATYPGASAEVIAQTVATPLELEINGVDDMLYINSQSTGDGRLSINVVFKPGTNIDQAQVNVQNRVAVAQPRLPEDVQRLGIVVRKASPDLMMVVHMTSPDDSRDQQYISNYATLYVKDVLGRIDGVGNVIVFGARDYSMRVWLDPARVAAHNLTAGEVMLAMRAANLQVAAGAINQAPAVSPGAFTLSVQTLGRLTSPEEFGNIVLRAETDGSVTRLRDVARIELGAQDYTLNAYLDNKNATALGIFQRPGSNAIATSNQIKATMERLKKDFPTGLDYSVVYNPTEFIQASVDAVIETLFEALLLVVIVVIVFLQTWRAAIIPLLAIPVSLIGSFAVMAAVGISFNTLSLFGLVLAIGIVVDDAIVVVENVERYLTQGMSPKAAAHKTMDEVGGALIAISLVLIAVFLPTAFITGLQGTFYRQFAITIAASTAISAFVSLTLSPAMAALLLKTHALSHVEKPKPTLIERIAWPLNWFFRQFNRGFEWLANFYGRATARLIRVATIVLVVYAGLLVLTGYTLVKTPTGLVPQLDRSYLIAAMQLPAGSTLERADKLVTPGVGDDHGDAGRRACRVLRRLRRRHLHQRAQHRRDLRHPEAVRAAPRPADGQDPGRPARQDVLPARGLRVRARAALGAGHRHRRRPQGLRAGSRRPRPAGARGCHLGAGRCGRPDAGPDPGLHAVQHEARRRSGPRSTAPRPSSSACRSRACSRRCRSTWARATSTTSTSSAAPTA